VKAYRVRAGGAVRWAADGGAAWSLLDASFAPTSESAPKASCEVLLPVAPGKIIGVGENFKKPEPGAARGIPSLFFMPPTALAPGGTIEIPDLFKSLAVEGELGVVLKKGGRGISETDAAACVLGYVVVNDFSGRDPVREGISNGLKKSCDGMLPVGPSLLVEPSIRDFRVKTSLNGELRHDADTKDMTHSIAEVIAFASKYVTLEAGDLLCMGAVDPKPFAAPGDRIRIEIPGLDVLETTLA
jgi:2-keto-4-pentenoate hydratase/2-oxohepta-3-ene-1,7-dioic acid hydratase in catechol pathway